MDWGFPVYTRVDLMFGLILINTQKYGLSVQTRLVSCTTGFEAVHMCVREEGGASWARDSISPTPNIGEMSTTQRERCLLVLLQ